MSSDSDVLYVADIARKLGKTESSVRAAVYRKSKSFPTPFKLAGLHAWRRVDVDQWLAEQAASAKTPDAGRRTRSKRSV